MIGFVIKKAFFDAWDNLIKLVGLNLMTVPFIGLFYLGFEVARTLPFVGYPILLISIVLYVMHVGVVAYFVRDIGNSQTISYKDYFKYLKMGIKDITKFALAWTLFFSITTFSIIYYFSGEGVVSLIPLAIVFWFSTVTSIAVLLFFPIKIRLEGDFRKVLKKCFILFLDNPGAGIFVFIYTLILVVLSIPTGGLLVPGPAAILCVSDTLVHMYELKYDYLEKNPEADRKKIPWAELTYELNENIGPRSLKSMIFPWKD